MYKDVRRATLVELALLRMCRDGEVEIEFNDTLQRYIAHSKRR